MKHDDDFIFDEWALLAKTDPEAFELRRRQYLEAFIQSSGRKKNLGKWLQREIDDVRSRAGTPQASLKAITGMMCDQLAFLGEELGSLKEQLKQVHAREAALLRLRW